MLYFKKGDCFTQEFCVTTLIYDQFVATFRDCNPLHTDEHFAREKGFSGKVMHGNILNGFISYFIGECLPTKNVIIHSQEIVYKHPVYLNDKLAFNAEVNDTFDSVGAVEFKFNFKNQDSVVVSKGKVQIGVFS